MLHFAIPNLYARRQNRKHDCAIGEKCMFEDDDAGLLGGSGRKHARLRLARRRDRNTGVRAKLGRGAARARIIVIDMA